VRAGGAGAVSARAATRAALVTAGEAPVIGALLEALRPKQWTKNLLLFAGLVFSQQLDQPDLVVRALLGFTAFCLLSGAVYVLNDLVDLASDRRHPRKRHRPIASGRLPVPAAIALVIPLLAGALAIGLWLGPGFTWAIGVYCAMNVAYTFGLKKQVLIDVFVIASGFVIRAIAGVELLRPVSPTTTISPWLLVCTFFGALFLAIGKRRRELANAGVEASGQRAVLSHYTPELLEGLLLVCAAASLMGYALYTIWPATVEKFRTDALLYTVPFVAYGIFRYLHLVRVAENTEDPSQVLLTDRPLAICVVLYVLTVVAILYHA
jgi:4-hydroxybenzoate polyprenyltransferase